MTKKFNEKQKEALKTISKNVLLSAGAGSGKTEVLSNRFVQIIEEGINASNILSITFTIKAAAEMRMRIARNIRDLINAKGELYDDNGWLILKSKYDMDYWNNQLVDLQSAQVSTIHSLCARILKENPVEAKLAPGTNVLEEEDSLAFEDNCFNAFIRDTISSGNTDVKFLLEKYSLYGFQNQLKGLLKYKDEILGYGEDREDSLKKLLDRYDIVPEFQISEFKRIAEDFRKNVDLNNLVTETGRKPQNSTIEKIKAFKSNLCDYISKTPFYNEKNDSLEKSIDSLKDSSIVVVKEFVKRLLKLYPYIKAYADRGIAKELLPYWFKVIETYVDYREAQRQEANVLTFGDLERKAIELLDNTTTIRDKYHKMFRFIMVDEFQDTNEQQKQLVYLLYGNSKYRLDKPGDMPEKNLFVVGDPKQSIYRFRNADVKVFHKVRKDIENGDVNNPGVFIGMNTNYRSHKNIVDVCNKFFPDVMGEDESQPVHYDPLEAGLDKDGAKVELITVAKPATGTGNNGSVVSADKRKAEAEVLAKKILELKADGVSFSNMTILIRAMTHVDAIDDALQKVGIPCVISSGKGFYKRPEVEDLICIFKACYSKYNVLELTVALKERFYVAYDEYDINRPLNKIIKATLKKLFDESGDEHNRKVIRQLLAYFVDVDESVNYDYDFSKIVIDRSISNYEQLIDWSKIFLYDKSFSNFAGDTGAKALLFPMEDLFETYVAEKLREYVQQKSDLAWIVSTQAREKYLYQLLNGKASKKFLLKPDILVKSNEHKLNKNLIVMDTKWKRLNSDAGNHYGIKSGDMYQMFAYSKKYLVEHIWLLYPYHKDIKELMQQHSNDILFQSVVENNGSKVCDVNIHVFFVDLANIDDSIDSLVKCIGK